MTPIESKEPPDHIMCDFCRQPIEMLKISTIQVKYYCPNHDPLQVIYYFLKKENSEWFLKKHELSIEHFRLCWFNNFRGERKGKIYELHEFKRGKYLFNWVLVKDHDGKEKTFSADWVLNQTPQKITSLLQMYRTFS